MTAAGTARSATGSGLSTANAAFTEPVQPAQQQLLPPQQLQPQPRPVKYLKTKFISKNELNNGHETITKFAVFIVKFIFFQRSSWCSFLTSRFVIAIKV